MVKARVKFNKSGSMKFIGHLDVMRYFQKAIRRAGIDVAYSQGFSPHQLISFAAPLGVGVTSDGEYMDIQLNSLTSVEDMKQKLNAAISQEMQVLEVTELPEGSKTAMSMVAAADYLVSLKDGYEPVLDFEKRFLDFLSQGSILVTKKTKKGEKQIDLKPFIYKAAFAWEDFATADTMASTTVTTSTVASTTALTTTVASTMVLSEHENGQKIYLQLICGSVVNIKPEQVMEAFYGYLGQEYQRFAYQIHRLELYTDTNAPKGEANPNGCGKERHLVPLGGEWKTTSQAANF